jgi:hypothetical protein
MTRGGAAVFGRLVREESGITMGLVVVTILLIGVMGAGLLTFVQRDLQTVIEVNRGQRSQHMADTGLQAARTQLAQTGFANQYNDPATATFSPDPANSSWAFNSASATCGALPSGPGKCMTTSQGQVRVTIRYLPPPISPSGTGSTQDPNYAPQALPTGQTTYPDGRLFFRVESDGVSSGTRRKIQAILVAQPFGAPITYFATGNIDVNGAATSLTDTSLFAGGNVYDVGENSVQGTDRVYGNWLQPGYNDKARPGNALNPALAANRAGVAAEGTITYTPNGGPVTNFNNISQKAGTQTTKQRYGKVDFDNRGTDMAGVTPTSGVSPYAFCEKGSTCWPSGNQPAGVITYPFDPTKRADFDFLKRLAISQNNYVLNPPQDPTKGYVLRGSNQAGAGSNPYPIPSPENTVYFVEFTSAKGKVTFEVDSGSTLKAAGVIVVVNGDFHNTTASNGFRGAVIIHDPNPTDSTVMTYEAQGGTSLEGFVNVEGNMILGGSASPFLGNGAHALPGFHQVKVWSWRECYNATCT